MATALVLLALEALKKPPRPQLVIVALVGVAAALVVGIAFPIDGKYYNDMISVGSFSRFFDVVFILIAVGAILIAVPYIRNTLEERGEYYALILFATIGMMFMAKAHDLTVLFLGLELVSVPLYILAGFYRHRVRSNEASLKYLVLGAFSTGFFLFGIALLYGSTGATNYDAIRQSVIAGEQLSQAMTLAGFGLLLVGFAFKVALVPFHMYAPDVYEGTPSSITVFLSTGPKVAGFAALLKIVIVSFASTTQHWWGVIWILAAITMTVGNITALLQNNLKRMLAFSGVAHAGYLAVAVLVGSYDAAFGLMYYVVAYAAATLAAFGVVALVEGVDETGLDIADYRGLARRNPYLSAAFALAMISLAGFPPTAGFLGKYFVFNAAVDSGNTWYIWLVVIAILNSLVSVYYYLRPVVAMYMHPPSDDTPVILPQIAAPVFLLLVVVVLGFGIFPMTLVRSGLAAAGSLF